MKIKSNAKYVEEAKRCIRFLKAFWANGGTETVLMITF